MRAVLAIVSKFSSGGRRGNGGGKEEGMRGWDGVGEEGDGERRGKRKEYIIYSICYMYIVAYII